MTNAIYDPFNISGGNVPSVPPMNAGNVASFDLTNTEASSSSGLFKQGLAFPSGVVVSGNILEATISGSPIRVSMLGVKTWNDGSLMKCTLVGDAGSFTASEAKTVTVNSVAGSLSTSSVDPFAYLTANTDYNVQITNHSGSSSGVLSDRSYSLNTALTDTDRRKIIDNTDVCIRAFVWGHPSGEKHLMCLHYLDFWLDVGDNVIGIEWTPVMSQHWWIDDPFGDGAQTKERREFDISARDGTTVIESETGTGLLYNSRMAMLRTDDDDQHAKRMYFDEGTARPTLAVTYSLDTLKQMMKAGYIPPIAQGVTYDFSGLSNTYTPGGEQSGTNRHNHRRAINGTGGYNARGEISSMDAMCLSTQDPDLWRICRVSAQAGLLADFHHRDYRNLTEGELTLMPFPVEQLGAKSYTGLGTEVIADIARSAFSYDAPDNSSNSLNLGLNNWDNSHHHSYAYFMAFTEGEHYLEDACLSALDQTMREGPHDEFSTRPKLAYATVAARQSAQSIPNSEQYGATGFAITQERAFGWGMLALARGYQTLPDNNAHIPYIDNLIEHGSQYCNRSLQFWVTEQLSYGGWQSRFGKFGSVFMNCFNVLGAAVLNSIAADRSLTGIEAFRDTCGLLLANSASKPIRPFVTRDYRFEDSARLLVLDTDLHPQKRTISVTSDLFTATFGDNLVVRNDDRVIVDDVNSQNGSVPPPAGLAIGLYFVVNSQEVLDGTFQLSLTEGGSAVTGITDQASVEVGMDLADFGTASVDDFSAIHNADSTEQIVYATIEKMYSLSMSVLPEATHTAFETFYASRVAEWPDDTFASWNYDGDLTL